MNKAFLQRLAVGISAFFLLTALSWPTNLKHEASDTPAVYTFVDARPPGQVKSGFESLMVTNCAYGSIRIGDKDFTPGLATVLNDMLVMRFNEVLRGKAIKLVNFTVHQNGASAYRASLSNAYGGLIDRMMNDHKVTGCAADDLRGGYVASEVEPGKVPYVIVIDLEMDSQPIHARWVQAINIDSTIKGASRAETKALRRQAWDEDLGGAIDNALAKLGDVIGQALAQTPSESATSIPATDSQLTEKAADASVSAPAAP